MVLALGTASLGALGASALGIDTNHPRLQNLDGKVALLRWGALQGIGVLTSDTNTEKVSSAAPAPGAEPPAAGPLAVPSDDQAAVTGPEALPQSGLVASSQSSAGAPGNGRSASVFSSAPAGLSARASGFWGGKGEEDNEPPLAASGPGSSGVWFSRLKEFQFPTEDALLSGLGLTKGAPFDAAFDDLRMSLVGGGSERTKLQQACKKILDEDERNDALKQAPSVANLPCYFYRVQRLSKNLQKEIKARDREEDEADEMGIVSNPMPTTPSIPRANNFPRNIKSQEDWSRLVGLSYRQSIDRLRPSSERDALRLARYALHDPNPCLTTGARSGIMRSLEDYLPSEEVFEIIAALYVHQKNCLKPTEDSFEEIHFRMGLLFLERGRLQEAGSSFGFALEDREGRDAYRVLFWRGLLEALRTPRVMENDGARVSLNSYWQRLLRDYPLSFHALVADSITGYNLHKRLLAQPTPWVGVFQGSEWGAHNGAAFLFALAIARKDDRLAKAVGNFVIQSLDPAHFEQGLFFGLAQRQTGFTRGAIKAMFTSVSRYGSAQFNMEVLDLLYPRFYVQELERYGNDVDLALALSLMRQESSFNPQAASAAKAKGLMQVLPGTAKMMLRRKNINLFDPVQNIQAGTKYLQHLLERYDSNYVQTIASYNAGPGKITRWKSRYLTQDPLLFADLIPYRETRNYVSGLLRNIHWYRVLLNGDKHIDLISRTDTMTWTARSLVPDPAQWGIESLEEPINLVFEPVPDFRK